MTITLKLNPSPTFKATVHIPVPGEEKGAPIVCEFAHMPKAEYDSFAASAGSRTDLQSTMHVLRGWEGPDAPFSEESVTKLLQNYAGAAFAIAEKYGTELLKVRAGN